MTLQADGTISEDDAGADGLLRWSGNNLLWFREVVQPHLDQMMKELSPRHEDAGLSG